MRTMLAIFVASCCLLAQSSWGAVISLEPHAIQAGSLTVSGISAGGAMATQFHVAFSKDVSGVGVFAGIPYGCARGTLSNALTCMSSPGLTPMNTLYSRTDGYVRAKTIDDTVNVKTDKVYIFHGTKDTTVNPKNGEQVEDFYTHYGVPAANIKTSFGLAAVHCHPTDNFGSACGTVNSQYYINDCDYKGSFEALNFFYGGNLNAGKPYDESSLYKFDQKEFFPSGRPSAHSMDNEGFVYIPKECQDPTRLCKLHVAFHGCQQGFYKIGDVYVKNTGYLEVAEANGIIVLFPQVVSTVGSNPNGCFDWWGYDDNAYETKDGIQMDAIWKMIQKLGYNPVA